tara:strand:+ start:298 stop:957 length:660 start_codon:yes stop_codon:yes gene_type:complete
MKRLIVLDTETTGLDVNDGHRIIEIGCVEIIDRNITSNKFHQYINPKRAIDEGAKKVHGISNEMLEDKPEFSEIINDFLGFIQNSTLVIHNAPFDLGFLSSELSFCGKAKDYFTSYHEVLDTLTISRKQYPGKRNSLDALCTRLEVDNTDRNFHGALLDASLLANVYLKMTRGQTSLSMDDKVEHSNMIDVEQEIIERDEIIVKADIDEIEAHKNYFKN